MSGADWMRNSNIILAWKWAAVIVWLVAKGLGISIVVIGRKNEGTLHLIVMQMQLQVRMRARIVMILHPLAMERCPWMSILFEGP